MKELNKVCERYDESIEVIALFHHREKALAYMGRYSR